VLVELFERPQPDPQGATIAACDGLRALARLRAAGHCPRQVEVLKGIRLLLGFIQTIDPLLAHAEYGKGGRVGEQDPALKIGREYPVGDPIEHCLERLGPLASEVSGL